MAPPGEPFSIRTIQQAPDLDRILWLDLQDRQAASIHRDCSGGNKGIDPKPSPQRGGIARIKFDDRVFCSAKCFRIDGVEPANAPLTDGPGLEYFVIEHCTQGSPRCAQVLAPAKSGGRVQFARRL